LITLELISPPLRVKRSGQGFVLYSVVKVLQFARLTILFRIDNFGFNNSFQYN